MSFCSGSQARLLARILALGASAGSSGFSASIWSSSPNIASLHSMSYVLQRHTCQSVICAASRSTGRSIRSISQVSHLGKRAQATKAAAIANTDSQSEESVTAPRQNSTGMTRFLSSSCQCAWLQSSAYHSPPIKLPPSSAEREDSKHKSQTQKSEI